MSSEQVQTGSPARRAPNPWARVLIGLAVFTAAAVCCGWLVAQYLNARPVDLRAHTSALAGAAEQALIHLQIPAERITRAEAQPSEDPKALWVSNSLSVELPPGAALLSIVDPFKREMAAQGVSIAESSPEPLKKELDLSLLDHTFLSVLFTEKPLADLTATCNQIADEICVVLQTQGVPPEAVHRTPPERKQDDASIWNFTRIEAPAPETVRGEELEKMIRGALTAPDARVTQELGIQGTVLIVIALGEHRCVELALAREEPPPPPEEPAMPELPVLHGNGDGPELTVPPIEELPLDSSGLDAMELGRRLTGIKYPGDSVPRVAIIVDDGGYGGPVTARILGLNPALTVAILPYTPAARETAQKAAESGFEVMLHVPMEPADMPGRLTAKMSRAEIAKKTDEELAQIPQAVGVNNHIGSVFTADEGAITAFLENIKNRPLFFIDSRTTAKSKAYDTAKRLGIPAAMRDVFLDNEPDPNYIIGQFNQLMDVAKERGTAIGICHFRSTTAPVLTQMLPQLERNGIALVHVSELLQKRAEKAQ